MLYISIDDERSVNGLGYTTRLLLVRNARELSNNGETSLHILKLFVFMKTPPSTLLFNVGVAIRDSYWNKNMSFLYDKTYSPENSLVRGALCDKSHI